MNSPQRPLKPPKPSLEQKLAQAQAEQVKWSKVALDPALSQEAAQVARNAARSFAAISSLYQKALAYRHTQEQDDQNARPDKT